MNLYFTSCTYSFSGSWLNYSKLFVAGHFLYQSKFGKRWFNCNMKELIDGHFLHHFVHSEHWILQWELENVCYESKYVSVSWMSFFLCALRLAFFKSKFVKAMRGGSHTHTHLHKNYERYRERERERANTTPMCIAFDDTGVYLTLFTKAEMTMKRI